VRAARAPGRACWAGARFAAPARGIGVATSVASCIAAAPPPASAAADAATAAILPAVAVSTTTCARITDPTARSWALVSTHSANLPYWVSRQRRFPGEIKRSAGAGR
jgi:hypothetical protein